jgi:hypothetical protein
MATIRTQDNRGPRGWPLVSKARLQVGDLIYNRGSELPVDQLDDEAIQRLVPNFADWLPPSDGRPKPQPVAKAATPKPRPAVQLVEDRDPVTAWQLTVEANTRAMDGNKALAIDALMSDLKGRNLYLLASKEAGRSL